MRYQISGGLFSLMVCLAPGLSGAAEADKPSPSPSPSPLPTATEYVEVTATRVPEDPAAVPAPIEVVGGDELRARGATDLNSALALATGIDIAPGGDAGPAGAVPEFWGLKEFDAFLLVVDGVPWGGAFNPALTTLDLTDVERVEILRGAAPVMYGATSFVGVIHVVHRGAGATERSGSVRGGSYQSGAADLNLPLGSWAGFASRLDVDGERRGFSDERTAYRRGHLRWRNSRALGEGALRFDVDGTLLDQDPASPHLREGRALSTRTPLDANYDPEGAFLNDRRVTLTAGYDRSLAPGAWATLASFSHASHDARRGFLADPDHAVANARGLRQKIDFTDVYFDSHLAFNRGPHARAVVGLDHLHGEAESKGADFDYFAPLAGGPRGPTVEVPGDLDIRAGDRREFSGAYGFVEWDPTPRLRFEGGVRLNRTQERREGEEGGVEPAGGEPEQERTTVRPGGALGAILTVWERGADRLRLYADYRNTFKPGAIDFGIGESEEEEGILKPETAASYEGGVKATLAGGRLALEAEAFQMDFDNLVVATTVGGLPGLTNAGKERFKGIEASVAWRLAHDLSGRASYSFHDAKFVDFVAVFDGVPTQLGGKRLGMSARKMASAGVLYLPARRLFASAELNWVGSRFLNKRNTALAGGYATFGASLGYRAERWSARIDGRNLNDERAPVAESELGDAQYYRLPARRLDVAVSLKF